MNRYQRVLFGRFQDEAETRRIGREVSSSEEGDKKLKRCSAYVWQGGTYVCKYQCCYSWPLTDRAPSESR